VYRPTCSCARDGDEGSEYGDRAQEERGAGPFAGQGAHGDVAQDQGDEEVNARAGELDLPADLIGYAASQLVPQRLRVEVVPVPAVLLEATDCVAEARGGDLVVGDGET
jgi:hypothetical protein